MAAVYGHETPAWLGILQSPHTTHLEDGLIDLQHLKNTGLIII